jgi:RHS repeat-associated protein
MATMMASGILAQYDNTVSPATTFFAHKDHLGSTRLLTRGDALSNPSPVAECDGYQPFGELGASVCTPPVGSAATATHKFTGKERDPESNLDYFGARYFDSTKGRFNSVDPSRLSVDLADPQTWNRYSYTENRPLARVDRNGKWSSDVHDLIIDRGLSFLTDIDRYFIKLGSRKVDRDQRADAAHKHAQRSGYSEKPNEARRRGSGFISEMLGEAVQAQLEWESRGMSGNSPKALRLFGEASHPVTDATSPWHDNYNEPWFGYTQFLGMPIGAWGHPAGEKLITYLNLGSTESRRAMAEYEIWLLWKRYQKMLEDERKEREKEEKKHKKEKEKKTTPN